MVEKSDTKIRVPMPGPIGPMPPPYDPYTIHFDCMVGDQVKTIYGELGYVETCALQRMGIRSYYIQVSIDKGQWLTYDQFEVVKKGIGDVPMPMYAEKSEDDPNIYADDRYPPKEKSVTVEEKVGFTDTAKANKKP